MSAFEQLKALEGDIVAAGARQRELQQGKAAAVHAVREKDEALVRALEANLDGSPGASAAEKALHAARKRANEPWDARIEAAGRLVSQAQQRRSQFVAGNLNQLLEEMAEPAKGWPERARAALDELERVAVEYETIARPMEQLAREGGRPHLRAPDSALPLSAVRRLVSAELHPPVLTENGLRAPALAEVSVSSNASARFVVDDERTAA